jgi:hypothetical protein
MVDSMRADGKNPRTVQYTHATLRSARSNTPAAKRSSPATSLGSSASRHPLHYALANR